MFSLQKYVCESFIGLNIHFICLKKEKEKKKKINEFLVLLLLFDKEERNQR